MHSSSSPAGRLRSFAVLLFAVALVCAISARPARAADGFPITESFTNTTAPGWQLGGTAILTAPGTDTAGNGWLRLTPASGNSGGYAFYDTAFPSTKGASVEFDYATYGGSGADGLTFFLYDGTTTAGNFRIGAFGGSLGYTSCSSTPGLRNAYIGVGFDEFGNFTNLAQCGLDGSVARPNWVSVRGSEANGFPLLTSTSVPNGLTGNRSAPRHVTIAVLPDGKLTVTIKFPNGAYQTVTSNYQLPIAPSTLKLGYAASTGGSTNIHEIRNTQVVKPTDLKMTVTDGAGGADRTAPRTWTATVTNTGPNQTEGETITASTGAQSLSGVTWTCTSTGGAVCGTASGSGLPTSVAAGAMPVGSTLSYAITGTPAGGTDFAQMAVTATPTGDTGDITAQDNSATDTTDLTPVIPASPTFSLASNGTATATRSSPVRGGSIVSTQQWQRCDADGTGCVDIAGATALTYATTTADRGSTIRFRQIATNAAGTTTSDSAHYEPLPSTTLTSAPAAQTSSQSATFTFTTGTAGATFECRLDGGSWSTCTSPRTLTGLSDGSHTFQVRAVYGGLSDATPESHTWTVDTTAPNTSITTPPSDPTSATTASIPFTGTDGSGTGVASFECRLDGGAWSACTSPRALAGLADGSHTLQVRAIDVVGNVDASPASTTWLVDTTAPTAQLDSGPSTQSATAAPSFAFSGADAGGSGVASFECRLDGGSWAACTSPRTLSGLADGSHTFDVRSVDNAGNRSTAATRTWTVDTTDPVAQLDTTPPSFAATSSASLTFSGADAGGTGVASYECRLDTGSWSACSSPVTIAGLADGSHTFEARAVDGAGNRSAAASHSWTVDTVAPDTTISAAPPAISDEPTASLTFTGADPGGSGIASFACRLDGGAWTPCTSPVSLSALADGAHAFEVRAIDRAGNVDATPASHTWTVDTTAPTTSITSGPASRVASAAATLAFSSGDGTGTGVAGYECRLDAGAWSACTSPASITGLVDGDHRFDVRAYDGAGIRDASPASRTWTVDTTGPDAPVVVAPAGNAAVPSRRPELTFTAEPGAELAITVDGDVVARVTVGADGTARFTPVIDLADGEHTVSAVPTDDLGNVGISSAIRTFRVLATSPAPPAIPTLPAKSSSDPNPVFAFTPVPGMRLQCQLDGGAWSDCPEQASFAGLADGTHELKVRLVNEAGVGSEPQSYTWTVDTVAPQAPVLVDMPDGRTRSSSARFTLSLEPGTTAQCSIDGAAWVDCTTGFDASGLTVGPHAMRVRQIDAAGNVSTETLHTWQVGATGVGGTPRALTIKAATKVVAKRGRVTAGCSLDRGSVRRCTITAYARIGGKLRVVGRGTGSTAEQGQRHVGVTVRLNARGRRLVSTRLNGLVVRLSATVTPFGWKQLTTRRLSRVYADRLTRTLVIWPFDTDDQLLGSRGRRTVDRISDDIRGARRITCVGHTDSRGTKQHNLRLGLRRARIACRALEAHGVTADIGAQSWGESRPRATNRTAAGRKLNRRVEVIVRY